MRYELYCFSPSHKPPSRAPKTIIWLDKASRGLSGFSGLVEAPCNQTPGRPQPPPSLPTSTFPALQKQSPNSKPFFMVSGSIFGAFSIKSASMFPSNCKTCKFNDYISKHNTNSRSRPLKIEQKQTKNIVKIRPRVAIVFSMIWYQF